MEKLPSELCIKVFHLLDHHTLASAIQVCRKWNLLASENVLWCNLFKERWRGDRAAFFAPHDSRSWKDVYIVQDRCDRYGLGLKIIREGCDYYLIHQGEIQRYLGGSGKPENDSKGEEQRQPSEIAESILFFIGDLESACANAKRVWSSNALEADTVEAAGIYRLLNGARLMTTLALKYKVTVALDKSSPHLEFWKQAHI